MEAETAVSDDTITREGMNPSREEHWVSPQVAAAQAGGTIDFSKHVPVHEDVETEEEDPYTDA